VVYWSRCLKSFEEVVCLDQLLKGLLVEANAKISWDHGVNLEKISFNMLQLVKHS